MKTASKARASNMGKLKEASRIAMTHPVLMCLDVDELKTLSLAPWCEPSKPGLFRLLYQDLGVFSAMPGETRWQVFCRLWEEAVFAGALLSVMPNERWVCGVWTKQSPPKRALSAASIGQPRVLGTRRL